MKSPSVTGKSDCVLALKGSTPRRSSRRATMMAKHSESSPDSSSTKLSLRGASFFPCSCATFWNSASTCVLTVIPLSSLEAVACCYCSSALARNEKLGVSGDAAVANADHVDEFGENADARDAGAHAAAPVHRGAGIIDHERQDLLVADVEGLDEQGEPGANIGAAGRADRHRAGVGGTGDFKLRVVRERVEHAIEIAAQPRGIELAQQIFDRGARGHDGTRWPNADCICAPIWRSAACA